MSNIKTTVICMLAALSLALSAGCLGKECMETCKQDDDCRAGLRCYSTEEGQICLPRSCSSCFDSDQTCYIEKDYEEGRSPYLQCEFKECQ